jgi:hypothetical protein
MPLRLNRHENSNVSEIIAGRCGNMINLHSFRDGVVIGGEGFQEALKF